jgi:hypothetical protein
MSPRSARRIQQLLHFNFFLRAPFDESQGMHRYFRGDMYRSISAADLAQLDE